jgi:hypothetical protein
LTVASCEVGDISQLLTVANWQSTGSSRLSAVAICHFRIFNRLIARNILSVDRPKPTGCGHSGRVTFKSRQLRRIFRSTRRTTGAPAE